MRKVVSAHEMRAAELAAANRGVSVESMIECAGTAIADLAAERAGGGQVLILVGPGNNGSDGLFAAERLRRSGLPVVVYSFRRAGPGVFEGTMMSAEEDSAQSNLRMMTSSSAVLVDALLGIGQTRPPEGILAETLKVIRNVKQPSAYSIAVDIPTGVNADTGVAPGESFEANVTLCMGYLKRGIVVPPGKFRAGTALTVDVGIPEDLDENVHVSVPLAWDIAHRLPVRNLDGNKGSYGRLVVVAGSADYVGAPALVGQGAYRAGAGLVEVAVPLCIQSSVAAHSLEAIFSPLPHADGRVSSDAVEVIRGLLSKAAAMVYGPGLGISEATRAVTRDLLGIMDSMKLHAAVIDADGLTCLSELPDWWAGSTPLVLTPHPGEMSRLTHRSIQAIQENRIETAMHYAVRWKKVVVLKGAGTIIASPDGEAVVNPTGGPNLSTAGTGDVLSGVIGGLLAQGCRPFDAAVVGAYLHGAAGDLLRSQLGDAGTLAGDLPRAIPEARLALLREAGVAA